MVLRYALSKDWCIAITFFCLINSHAMLAENDTDINNLDNSATEQSSSASPKKVGFEAFLEEISGNTDKRPVDAFDLEELQRELLKILASHYKSLFEKRNAMFEILPEQDQQRIKTAEQLYQKIVEKIDITTLVLSLTDSIKDLDTQGSFAFLSDEKHQDFTGLLEKLRTSLLDRTFVLLFKGLDDYDSGNPAMMASPEQMINMTMQLGQNFAQAKPLSLKADELEQLVNFFDEISTHLGIAGKPEAVNLLHAFLLAVHNKQSTQIAALVITSIKEDFNKAFVYLKESVARFEKALEQEQESSFKEAYDFWLKTLRRFHRSLWVFDALQTSASFDSTKLSHHLFTFVTYGYDIAQGFFDLYKLDNNVSRISGPVAADWALSASLATWHFFNMKSDFYNGLLLNTILGDLKIDTFEARQLLMYNAMLLPTTLPVLFDPSFWNKKPYGLAKALHKVATAWVYYMVVDSNLFSDGNDEVSWWTAQNPGDRHIRKALLYALDEGTHYVSRMIQQSIVYNINPMALENARTYSMGIIRPAIVGSILKATVPFIFLNDSELGNPAIPGLQHVVAFDRNDLFKSSSRWLLPRCMQLPTFMKHTRDTNCQGFARDEYYIEYVLASYIGESIGSFWGRKLVQGYKSELYTIGEKAAGMLGSVLETVGLMSHDQIQAVKEFKNDFVAEFEYDLVALKFLLRGIFEVNSSFRNVIIPLLINRGYLDEGETNPIEINRVIVYFVVNFLAQWKLLTYYDAAKIVHKFDNDPQATEKMIDNIVEGILGNLAGTAGEYIGNSAGGYLAEWLIFKTGPLYARFNTRPAQAP